MEPIDFSQARQEGKGFQFPGDFEITAVGNASADLPAHIPEWLDQAGLRVVRESVKHRHSEKGNFVSVTVTFHCDNREQYELAHTIMREKPGIRYTL